MGHAPGSEKGVWSLAPETATRLHRYDLDLLDYLCIIKAVCILLVSVLARRLMSSGRLDDEKYYWFSTLKERPRISLWQRWCNLSRTGKLCWGTVIALVVLWNGWKSYADYQLRREFECNHPGEPGSIEFRTYGIQYGMSPEEVDACMPEGAFWRRGPTYQRTYQILENGREVLVEQGYASDFRYEWSNNVSMREREIEEKITVHYDDERRAVKLERRVTGNVIRWENETIDLAKTPDGE